MRVVYDYLTDGTYPTTGSYLRKRNLRRAAARFQIIGERLYTRGEHPRRVCITDSERQEALRLAHDEGVAGHWAGLKTWHRLKQAAYWPGYAEDAHRYAATCAACQGNGGRRLEG